MLSLPYSSSVRDISTRMSTTYPIIYKSHLHCNIQPVIRSYVPFAISSFCLNLKFSVWNWIYTCLWVFPFPSANMGSLCSFHLSSHFFVHENVYLFVACIRSLFNLSVAIFYIVQIDVDSCNPNVLGISKPNIKHIIHIPHAAATNFQCLLPMTCIYVCA